MHHGTLLGQPCREIVSFPHTIRWGEIKVNEVSMCSPALVVFNLSNSALCSYEYRIRSPLARVLLILVAIIAYVFKYAQMTLLYTNLNEHRLWISCTERWLAIVFVFYLVDDRRLKFSLNADLSFGNCPKYIATRKATLNKEALKKLQQSNANDFAVTEGAILFGIPEYCLMNSWRSKHDRVPQSIKVCWSTL